VNSPLHLVTAGWSVGGGGSLGTAGKALTVLLGAVAFGVGAGFLLTPRGDDSGGKPDAPIEWNAVQGAPTRVPDAEDVAWERRAGGQDSTAASSEGRRMSDGPMTVAGQQIRVIDGDTFDVGGTRVRVAGIDAPETHPARCAAEQGLGLAATAKLAELLRGRPLWISGNQTDRYGRSVRTVRVGGRDVAEAMISSGLARNYDGKKRQGWC